MVSTESIEEILYPTGHAPDEEDLRSLHQQKQAVLSRPSSFFFVSNKFESLNYTKIINRLEVEKEKTRTFRTKTIEDFLRILYFLMTGVCTAIIGVILELCIENLGSWKYKFFCNYFEENFNGSIGQIVMMTFLWFLGVIVPVMVGSLLVVFIAPFAAGGGVAQCIGYLNGVRVPHILTAKCLAVKAVSTTCSVISGLAGGMEGPMIHMGALVGGSLPSVLPCTMFKSDRERRDLAAAGFGAGIAVAFGAPIGGLLLALEEGISFWEVNLMWKTYLGILMAYLVSTILLWGASKVEGDSEIDRLDDPELLTFGRISSDVTNYELFELFLFSLEGVIGGLFGALIVKIHIHFTLLRRRFVQTKIRKLTESFLVACVVASLSLLALMLLNNCSDSSTMHQSKEKHFAQNSSYLTSASPTPRNNYLLGLTVSLVLVAATNALSVAILLAASITFVVVRNLIVASPFQTPLSTLRDALHVQSLCVFCAIYFLLINLTMGVSISTGIFVPQILFGAAWGRVYGHVLQNIAPSASWVKLEKYAYLGAAAQLSGTIGKTFSVLVIMFEASGSIVFCIPLMVVVSITRYVQTFFVIPIYETQVHLMGIPFLPSNPPPLSVSIPTSSIMSAPPLVTLPLAPSVQTILNTLQSNQHNGFPIVNKGSSVGLILRQQLLVLLQFKAYKYPPPQTTKQMCQCLNLYLKYARRNIKLQDVHQQYLSVVIDLSPYYDPHPYSVNESMPLSCTYRLFRSLGLRHVLVLNNHNEITAMVTRKDLAKYHTWETLGRMGVKEMIIRP